MRVAILFGLRIGGLMIHSAFQDLRYGWRMLFKSKGLTLAAVLSLGLGIGTNALVFSIADALVFKDLPLPNPDELVLFRTVGPEEGRAFTFTSAVFDAFTRENETLATVFAYRPISPDVNVIADGRPGVGSAQLVTGEYHRGLGVAAHRGRTIEANDDTAAADPVAVIGYSYWRDRFGMNPSVIGARISINGAPFTIVGVTPPEFYVALKGNSSDITIPMAMAARVTVSDSQSGNSTSFVRVMGRMKPGVTPQQVTANLQGAFSRTADSDARARFEVISAAGGVESLDEAIGPAVLLHFIGVIILLVVCTNLANLMLARSDARRHEAALRSALGSNRLRLIRQFLTESVLLSLIGGGLGFVSGYWIVRLFAANVLLSGVSMDVRALAFTAALSIVTGVLFGLAPAIKCSSTQLITTLQDTARTLSGSRSRIGKALLITQMTISFVLLTGAGMLTRTLSNIEGIDARFNIENLITFRLDPRLNRYDANQIPPLYERITARIAQIPGVLAVTISDLPLLNGAGPSELFIQEFGVPTARAQGQVLRVGENFFRTMEIPILSGRTFTPQDGRDAPHVAMVSESLAREYFGTADPIGQRLGFDTGRGNEFEIVGVVRDARYFRLSDETPAIVYVAAAQTLPGAMSFSIRTAGAPETIIPAVRDAIGQIDSSIPLLNVSTRIEQWSELLQFAQFTATIGSVLGIFVLLLACIGLYGIVSHNVISRTIEMGVRMAFGARRLHVLGLVLGETGRLVLVGLAIGIPISLLLIPLVAGFFYGVAPTDLFTVGMAALILTSVTALAGYLPARRAARLAPLSALRHK